MLVGKISHFVIHIFINNNPMSSYDRNIGWQNFHSNFVVQSFILSQSTFVLYYYKSLLWLNIFNRHVCEISIFQPQIRLKRIKIHVAICSCSYLISMLIYLLSRFYLDHHAMSIFFLSQSQLYCDTISISSSCSPSSYPQQPHYLRPDLLMSTGDHQAKFDDHST